MKKIIYILLPLMLLFSGNVFAVEGDQDNDGIVDSVDNEDTIDDPNTQFDERKFVCTARDIEQHISARAGFVDYGCDAGTQEDTVYERLGVFSQGKVDRINDTDDDGVLDIEDTEPNSQDDITTPFDETRYICNSYESRRGEFDCEGRLGAYSDEKRKRLFDTDRDGVNDFEDLTEPNNNESERRFVCTKRDLQDLRLGGRYGCTNINQLGTFSQAKKDYILDDRFNPGTNDGGGLGIPGQAIIDGEQIRNGELNLDTGNIKEGTERNKPLKELQSSGDGFILSSEIGERGIFDVLVAAARDLKNIFFLFAIVFFLYIVIRLLLSENTEEDTSKFKRGILWITIGIVIMQLAYSFVVATYDTGLGSEVADSLVQAIINPLIALLETLASFFFIIMGIIAFYRLVTSNGEEQAATDAKTTMINAVLGFILIQLASRIVQAVFSGSATASVNPTAFTDIIIGIINWLNGFVGIAVILMIIYTGVQVLLSSGEEEVITNAKKSLTYIIIGVVILLTNLLILTFFFNPSTTI